MRNLLVLKIKNHLEILGTKIQDCKISLKTVCYKMVIHVSIEKDTLIFKMKDGSFYCSSVFHQNICFFTTTTCPSGLPPRLPVSWLSDVSGAYMTWGGGAVGWRCGGWGWRCYPEPSPASDSGRGSSLLVSCTGLVSTKILGPCNI